MTAALLLGVVLGASPGFPSPADSESALTFDTPGGEAWTFQKLVSGHVRPGKCEAVLISSPRGQIRASVANDHTFVARVPLRSGSNILSAVCRSDGRDVGRPSVQQWNVRLPDRPHAAVRVQVIGNEVVLDGGATALAPGLPSPIVRYDWRERKGNPAPLSLTPTVASAPREVASTRVEIAVPATEGRYYVTLRATDALGRSDEATAVFRSEGCQAVLVDTQREHPAWADTAVVYGIALPLFEPDAFQAVTNRLAVIAALGATVIWLSPVAQAPANDFGYAVTDPFALRTAFGSDAQLRALIAAAHARGLHIILDAVTNQLAQQSRYFADTQAHGKASPYYDWFARDASGRPLHYFDWQNLENLNYDNAEVRSFLTAALTHWLKAYAVDGFRIDAAWALRQRAPDFWPAVRRELERVDPDIWLLAEASARDSYYSRHGFDAAYDWTMTVGQWAWQGAFKAPSKPPNLAALRAALGSGVALPALHFINDNDTGKRFITLHGAGETRVAAALLFTLPGIPLIYDGDETGAAFEPYSSHAPLSWDDEHGFAALYTGLARTRREVPALIAPLLTLLRTDHDDEVLAYLRGRAQDPTAALVLLNFTARPVRIALRNDGSEAALTKGPWVASDLLTRAALPGPPALNSLRLPAYGGLLLQHPQGRARPEPSQPPRGGSSSEPRQQPEGRGPSEPRQHLQGSVPREPGHSQSCRSGP